MAYSTWWGEGYNVFHSFSKRNHTISVIKPPNKEMHGAHMPACISIAENYLLSINWVFYLALVEYATLFFYHQFPY